MLYLSQYCVHGMSADVPCIELDGQCLLGVLLACFVMT